MKTMRILCAVSAMLMAVASTNAAVVTWDGQGGNTNYWRAPTNWFPNNNSNPGTGDDIMFGMTNSEPTTNNLLTTIGSLTFSNSGWVVRTTNHSSYANISLTRGITNSAGTGVNVWQMTNLTLGAAQTWVNAAGGTLAIGGTTLTNNLGWALSGGGSTIVTNSIQGTGAITNLGGTLTLVGANTFTNELVIQGGMVSFGSSNAVQTANRIALTSGTLQYTGGTAQGLTNGSIVLGATTATTDVSAAAGTLNVNGIVSGGMLTKVGAGRLALLNSGNSFNGGVAIGGGTLNINAGDGALGATPGSMTTNITFTGNSALQVSGASPIALNANRAILINSGVSATVDVVNTTLTLTAPVTGDGTLVKSGASNLTLLASNLHTGGTKLLAGALLLARDDAAGTGLLSLNGGFLTSTGSEARTLSNPVAIGGTITLGSTGADNGDFTFNGGVDLGAVTRVVTNLSTVTFAGIVSNGGLTKAGSGLMILSGANTSTGTIVNAGTLRLGASERLADAGILTVNNGGRLELNGYNETVQQITGSAGGVITNNGAGPSILTVDLTGVAGEKTYNGNIDGNVRMVVRNSATQTDRQALNGTNSFTGGLVVESNGVLRVLSDLAIGAVPGSFDGSNITLRTGGKLLQNGSDLYVSAIRGIFLESGTGTLWAGNAKILSTEGVISGPGSLEIKGDGAVWLRAANTYEGFTVLTQGTVRVGNDAAFSTNFVRLGGGLALPTVTSLSNETHTVANGFVIMTNVTLGAGAPHAGTLTFTGGFDLSAGSRTLTVSAPMVIQGVMSNGGLVKAGTSPLTLYGANDLAFVTNSAGTLRLGADNTLGTGTVVFAGGNLTAVGAGARLLTNAISLAANAAFGALSGDTGTLTLSGGIDLGGAIRTIVVNSPTVMSGSIANTTNLVLCVQTNATLTLSGNSSFTGTVNITTGTVVITTSGALGVGPKTVLMSNGTAGNPQLHLDGSGGDITLPNTISFQTSNNRGNFINLAGSNTIQGDVTMTSGGGDTVVDVRAGFLTLSGSYIPNATVRILRLGGAADGLLSGYLADNAANIPGLVKEGTGTWTLTGTNTYSGTTTISTGKLRIAASGFISNTPSITVASGAVLDVADVTGGFQLTGKQLLQGAGLVTGNVTAVDGVRLAANTSGTIGTLTFANDLTLTSGTTNLFDLGTLTGIGGGTNDLIAVGGALTPGSSRIIVNATQPLDMVNAYRLFTYGGAKADTFGGVDVPATRYVGTLSEGGGVIDVTFSGGPQTITWSGSAAAGAAGSTWDLTNNVNWQTGTEKFYTFDNVIFDESSPSNLVTLAGSLQPQSVMVQGASNYTLAGTGKLTGVASLTKTGSGTLTVSTTNDYNGHTWINNGILRMGVSNAAVLGSTVGKVFVTNGTGTLDINRSTVGAKEIVIAGAGFNGMGAIVNNGSGFNGNALAFLTMAGDATIGGSQRWDVALFGGAGSINGGTFALTKIDANIISLKSVPIQVGTIYVNAGDLRIEAASTINPDYAIALAPASTNSYWNLIAPMGRDMYVTNATIYAGAGTGASNTFTGTIRVSGAMTNIATGVLNFNGAILGDGSLAKLGTSILTLGGTNTYSGATTVGAGTLALGPAGSISNTPSIALASGTMLDVSQVSGGWTLFAHQTLSGAASVNGSATVLGALKPGASAGTMVYSNDLTLAGASLEYELSNVGTIGGGVNDLIDVKSNLTLSGVNTLTIAPISGTLASSYTIFTYGGALAGGAANLAAVPAGTLRPGYTFDFSTATASQVTMNVTGTAVSNLVWVAGNGTWDVTNTVAWAGGQKFYQTDRVTFGDDGATGGDTNVVTLSGSLFPGAVTVNSTGNYFFAGGSFSGSAALLKDGTGELTLTNANAFSGGTVVSNGTLYSRHAGALGSGSVTVDGGLLAIDTTLGHMTNSAGIAGSATIRKLGANNLVLTGSNGFSGVYQVVQATAGQGLVFNSVNAAAGLPGLDMQGGYVAISDPYVGTNAAFSFIGGTGRVDTAYQAAAGVRTMLLQQNTNTVFSGFMSDAGAGRLLGLTKAGTGSLTLSGSNTFSGPTTINGGVLALGNRWAAPSSTVNVAVNNGLAFANTNIFTIGQLAGAGNVTLTNDLGAGVALNVGYNASTSLYSGVLSDNGMGGSLVKVGGGLLLATNAHTYTGGTFVNGGVLGILADNNLGAQGGGLSFNGGRLQVTNSFTLGNRTVALPGTGNIQIDGSSVLTITNTIAGAGALSKYGTGTLILGGTNYMGNNVSIYDGLMQLTATSTNYFALDYRVAQGGTGTAATVIQDGAVVTVGTGGNGTLLGNAGGSATYYLNSGSLTSLATRGIILGVNEYSTGTLYLAGGNLNVSKMQIGRTDGQITNSSVGYVYQTGGTATVATLSFAGAGATSTNHYGLLAITSGVFTANAWGTWSAGFAATGQIYLGTGAKATLAAFPTAARGAGSYADIKFDGGSLSPTAAAATYMSNLDHAYLTTNGAIFDVAGGRDIGILQPLENFGAQAGKLTKTGDGTLTLNGTNVYSGLTTVAAGTLTAGSTNALPGIFAAGRYTVSSGAVLAVVNTITEPEVATMLGTGNFTANSFIGFDTALGNRTNGTVVADLGANPLGLAKLGANMLLVTNDHTYTGGTKILGGVVQVGNGGTIGTLGSGAILNHGLLVFNRSDAIAVGGVISGTGSVTKAGAGTLTLNAANLYTGITTVRQGRVISGIDNALPVGTPVVLGQASTAGVLDLASYDQTIGALSVVSTNNVVTNSILIAAGKTLTTLGNVDIGANVLSSAVAFAVSGEGAWVVTNGSGTFRMGMVNLGNNAPGKSSMDLSGLAAFRMDLGSGSMTIGYSGDNSAPFASIATLAASNALRAATITIGGSNIGSLNYLKLGSGTNILSVNNLNLGTVNRDSGLLVFNGASGGVSLRDATGTGRANVTMGTNANTTGYTATNVFDVTGHPADLLIGTLTIGSYPGRVGAWTNAFSFDTGVLDVSSILMSTACKTGTGGTNGVSSINIGGGTANLGSVSLSSSVATGMLFITGGTVTMGGDISQGTGGKGMLFLNGGTLDMQGNNIGTGGVAVMSLNWQSGRLKNVGQINNGAPLVKTTSGTLTLEGANAYSGGTSNTAGKLALAGDNVLGSGTLSLAGGTLASDSTAARVLTNAIRITLASGLGDLVNNGKLTLSGTVNLAGASRFVTNYSTVVMSGGSTNGQMAKYGPGTLILQGTHNWLGSDSGMFDGTVIVDGGTITNDAVIFRPAASLPGGLARLVITNGGSIVMTGTARNFRAGYQAGDGSQTNILDVAGIVRMPDASAANGRLVLGSDSALGIANLLAGGDLQIRYAQSGDQTFNGDSVLNLNGGILRPLANEANYIRSITAANVQSGGAIFDTSGFDVGVGQPLLNGGGGGGLTKQGTGTLKLTGTNTYTGMTRVMAGVLELSGSGSVENSTTLQIDSGATLVTTGLTATLHLKGSQTLKGHGTFQGGLIADSSSTIAPGTSAGILSFDGNLQMDSGSVLDIELNGLTVGVDYDRLAFNNNTLTLNSPTLNIALGFAPATNDMWTIVAGLGTAAVGTFNGLPNGAEILKNYGGTDYTLKIKYNSVSGGDANNDITLTVVPEPGSIGILGLAVVAALLRRRNRA